MAITPKQLEPFDLAVVDALRAAADERGMSGRKLSELSGLGNNRVAIILRGDPPPATVGEVARLALALGVRASELFLAAEAAASDAPPESWVLAADVNEAPTDRERFEEAHDHDHPA